MSIYTDIVTLEQMFNDYCFDPETGEINDENEQALIELHSEIINQGVENLCKLRANLMADADALKAEKMRIANKQAMKEKAVARVEKMIKFCLDNSGKEKINAGSFTVSTRKSEQVILADGWSNGDFGTFEFKADKAKIKKAIKDGAVVDGAELVTNYNLQVK